MILKRGAVVVLKDSVEIARVYQPGAVFGEIGALSRQPHSADVLALEHSEFHVADAKLLLDDPTALLYVARITAARLLAADNALLEAKKQSQAGYPATIDELLRKLAEIRQIAVTPGRAADASSRQLDSLADYGPAPPSHHLRQIAASRGTGR